MVFKVLLEWLADKIDRFWPVIIRIIVYGLLIGILVLSGYFLYSMGVIKLEKALPDCDTLNISSTNLVCESDSHLYLSSVYTNGSMINISEQNKTYICKKIDPLSPGIYPDYLKCFKVNMTFSINMKQICKQYCE